MNVIVRGYFYTNIQILLQLIDVGIVIFALDIIIVTLIYLCLFFFFLGVGTILAIRRISS